REREGQAINESRMRSFFTEAFRPREPVSLTNKAWDGAGDSASVPQASVELKPQPHKAGRKRQRDSAFVVLASNLWSEAKNSTGRVTDEVLRGIARGLDASW